VLVELKGEEERIRTWKRRRFGGLGGSNTLGREGLDRIGYTGMGSVQIQMKTDEAALGLLTERKICTYV